MFFHMLTTRMSCRWCIVYDVSRRDTFENLDLWLQEIEVYTPAGGARNVVKVLVGNKIDKVSMFALPIKKKLRGPNHVHRSV